MEKDLTKEAMRFSIGFDDKIAELRDFADRFKDKSERSKIKDCANLIIGIINRDIIGPIIKTYPDIDPDR